ncbi:MAG TPA: hypothetical protein VIG03_05485 [Steroidobacteraceae bacterium]|jgi:ElaB/YqjD/DUF883 family membrane-anchored ribosome-binding protein
MEDVIETGKRGRRPAKNGGHAAAERSTEWKNLVADVEDLVKKVANVDDSEIAEMRAKVEDTLEKAKTSAGASIAAVRGRSEEVTEATDEYVRENPWAAIGIAAAVGIVIGFIAGRR